MSEITVGQRALELHQRAVVVDALDVSRFDRAHFLKMKQGGITTAHVTVALPGRAFREVIDDIRDFDRLVELQADLVMPVRTAQDIVTAKATGRVGLIYGLQNALPIEGDLRLVGVFHRLGLRVMQLTYMSANLAGDGCLEPRNAGLSMFGLGLVREMNRLRMLIDLSHVGERTTLEAIDASETPVAVTHSCVKHLVDHPRNKADEVIRALAARGGVMGITSLPDFVAGHEQDEVPTVEHYLRHIDHVASLVGVDHVGIGMDYVEGYVGDFTYLPSWGGTWTHGESIPFREVVARLKSGTQPVTSAIQVEPAPAADHSRPYAVADSAHMPEVTEGLLARGYAEEDVQKVLGGNWVRLLQDVWGE